MSLTCIVFAAFRGSILNVSLA